MPAPSILATSDAGNVDPGYVAPDPGIDPVYVIPIPLRRCRPTVDPLDPGYVAPEPSYVEPSYVDPDYVDPGYVDPSYVAPDPGIEPSFSAPEPNLSIPASMLATSHPIRLSKPTTSMPANVAPNPGMDAGNSGPDPSNLAPEPSFVDAGVDAGYVDPGNGMPVSATSRRIPAWTLGAMSMLATARRISVVAVLREEEITIE